MFLYQLGPPLKLPPLLETSTLKLNGLLVTLQFHFIRHKKKQWGEKKPSQSIYLLSSFTT